MASTQTITKSVTIEPGESFTLPNGATVVSVTGILSNSCDFPLPDPEEYKCGYFYFNIDDDSNVNHPNDETSTKITSVYINTSLVPIDELASTTNETILNTYITNTALFEFILVERYTINDPGDNKRKAVFLHFRAPATIFDNSYLIVTGNSGMSMPPVYRIYPEEGGSACAEV